MVYHGKQWYTMVLCDCTMVHPCATMVYCTRTMVHPCVTMVQAWYKKLIPWYIMVYHGTLYLYHSTSICNHMEQFTCTMVYYGIPSYIFIPPWYKYLITWYATVYYSTTLCYYGTSMAKITYTMVCYPLWKYTIVPLFNAVQPDCLPNWSILGGIISVEGIAIVHQSWGYHGT